MKRSAVEPRSGGGPAAGSSARSPDAFMAAAILYDVASGRRIHPVYICGAVVIVAFQFLRDVIGATAA